MEEGVTKLKCNFHVCFEFIYRRCVWLMMSLFCTVLSTVCQSVHHWWYFSFIMVLICGTQPVLFRTKKNILAFSSVVSTEWPIWSYVIENERMERISNLSESIIFVSLPLPAHNLNGFYLLYGLHDWHICSGSIMGLVWFQEPHKKQCPLHWREGKGVGGGGGVCSVSLLPEDETFTYEVLQLHPSSSMLVVGFNHMIWSNWPSNGW